ncbi:MULTISPECIES: hypothetical protein [Mycobacterium]|uniref:Secreted protein n=1 Tax=Mycobacterium kiyosense TaxID=2871094 RepID=A0A9P3UVK7_9MYCO|nr:MULTISPECIES: hypothetical protein [Mycobacterium]BDB43225.1 hypothetical protein IWGMT90018_36710 [Mycobacterium kiyosense]BDE13574.1 hypothetical protein MKCMC460_24340 [Mycobacterium sp. 20KCMC460]GLB83380.1 hypothetical protein SRL2020028_26360 [Mycobacterium kiyosense]GLB91102.1 hypothetical protein SRL2020130_39190 [Mycobacterium kiyosense]GLB97440.1 hypothetical protein SRL2020226_42160 [Mycobacterium kiyosense]
MKHIEDRPVRGRIPRSRGAVTGLLLVLLGLWGALIPFVGPNFDFAYTPGQSWTAARGWLEVLPGVATAVGGLLLIASRSRAGGMLGGWLAALGGAWFVVGGAFAPLLGIGSVGDPVAATERKRAVLQIAYFSGLGVLIAFLAGAAVARLAVRLARDVRPVAQPVEAVPSQQYSGLVEPDRDAQQTDVLTTPREQYAPAGEAEPKRGLFRRHRTPVAHQ